MLRQTQATLNGGAFVAGAFVGDQPGDGWNAAAYLNQVELIQQYGGTPIIFQSYRLTGQSSDGIVAAYAEIAQHCQTFIAFELGTMFAPFGKIYEIDTYSGLMSIPSVSGRNIPHSTAKKNGSVSNYATNSGPILKFLRVTTLPLIW